MGGIAGRGFLLGTFLLAGTMLIGWQSLLWVNCCVVVAKECLRMESNMDMWVGRSISIK
jgi:hypothetical protein